MERIYQGNYFVKLLRAIFTTVLVRDVWHGCKTHTIDLKRFRFEGHLDIIQLEQRFIVFHFLTTFWLISQLFLAIITGKCLRAQTVELFIQMVL